MYIHYRYDNATLERKGIRIRSTQIMRMAELSDSVMRVPNAPGNWSVED